MREGLDFVLYFTVAGAVVVIVVVAVSVALFLLLRRYSKGRP